MDDRTSLDEAAQQPPPEREEFLPSDYYEPEPEEVSLTLRLPAELRDDMKILSQVWRKLDAEVGKGKKISINDVMIRLLTVGRDDLYERYKGRPETDAEIDALVKRLATEFRAAAAKAAAEKQK